MSIAEIVTDSEYIVGIDLGGTTVRIGLFTIDRIFVDSVSFSTRVSDGPAALVSEMAKAIRLLTAKHAVKARSIGIGSPGPLDLSAGKLLQLPNFPGWEYFPLRDELAMATGQDVVLESDANVAALAELMIGAGKTYGVTSLVMWTLGTGVGGGIILDGQIWRGNHDMAGELGHLSVDARGLPCSCGSLGCLEQYASATAIAAAGRQWFRGFDSRRKESWLEGLTTSGMAELADEGHEGMRTVFADVGAKLGFAIAQIVNALDVPLYVVGGGVANSWHLFAPSLFRAVEQYSYVYRLGRESNREPRPIIAPALLGPQAGLVGASFIARGITSSGHGRDAVQL